MSSLSAALQSLQKRIIHNKMSNWKSCSKAKLLLEALEGPDPMSISQMGNIFTEVK